MIDISVRDGIMGLVVGDALGVPYEFLSRSSMKANPVQTMIGGGTHGQLPGTWSDDSSLTLCLLDSLSSGVNNKDIMEKFVEWLETASYTPYGRVFDIGITTQTAIQKYRSGTPPLKCGGNNKYDNGNGSLMRILPFIYYYAIKNHDQPLCLGDYLPAMHNVSALTHRHPISLMACGYYGLFVHAILTEKNAPIDSLQNAIMAGMEYYNSIKKYSEYVQLFNRIYELDALMRLSEKKIHSTGYVLSTLEAALWCYLNTDNYPDCVKMAVNLGNDTDTVAAVAGSLAGINYGYDGIPAEWLSLIPRRQWIEGLCLKITDCN